MIRWGVGVILAVSTICSSAQTGAIEGKVKLLPREKVTLKTATTYPGQPVVVPPIPSTPVPGVVFVEGPVPGARVALPTKRPSLTQKDAWFSPEVTAVMWGSTVDFPNLDNQYHNVFSYSKSKRFDLGRYPTGESRSVTFDKPGVVKVYCEIHEHMRAFVVVCENPWFAVTDVEGSYRIESVPAGKYTLTSWQARGNEKHKEVVVSDGQTTRIDFE